MADNSIAMQEAPATVNPSVLGTPPISMYSDLGASPVPGVTAAMGISQDMPNQLARQREEQQAHEELSKDKAYINYLKASDPNFNLVTPKGIEDALPKLKNKISDEHYNTYADHRLKMVQDEQTMREALMAQELAPLKEHAAVNDFAATQIGSAVEGYDRMLKESGGDTSRAQQSFEIQKKAALELLAGLKSPTNKQLLYPPEFLAKLSKMDPDQMRDFLTTSKYWNDHVKEVAETKLKIAQGYGAEARAERELAMAEKLAREASGDNKKHDYQSKSNLLVDGVPTEVAFDSKNNKYYVGDEEINPRRITTVEKGGVTPAQAATVETDVFEVKRFLDHTDPKATASLWFGPDADEGAIKRFTENKLKTKESRTYDVYANRLANAIVGMQSFGRYRGAVKSIDEARKLVPVPGDDAGTIKVKRDYVESLARNSEQNLQELSPPGHKIRKVFPDKEAAAPEKAVAPVTTKSAPTSISTQEDFDKLSSGTHFIGPDGKERIKP